MIDALLIGRLYGKPTGRTSKNGNPYATATVRTGMRDSEAVFVSVIAFSTTAIAALLALDDGDGAAIAGELKIGVYQSKDGAWRPSLDLAAHVVTTEYHVGRKRKAIDRDDQPAETDSNGPMQASAQRAPDFDDPIGF